MEQLILSGRWRVLGKRLFAAATSEDKTAVNQVDLEGLALKYEELNQALKDRSVNQEDAACALLSEPQFHLAFWQALAVALRCYESNIHSDGSLQRLLVALSGNLQVLFLSVRNAGECPTLVAQSMYSFLLGFGKTRAFHACSQLLAVMASGIQRHIDVVQEALQLSDSLQRNVAVSAAMATATSSCAIADSLSMLLYSAIGLAARVPDIQASIAGLGMRCCEVLAASIHDSAVLEHLSRVLLLSAQVAQHVTPLGHSVPKDGSEAEVAPPAAVAGGGPAPGRGEGSWQQQEAQLVCSLRSAVRWCGGITTMLVTFLDPSSSPLVVPKEILSGPCIQHLILASGIAALRFVDGGSVYGLPAEVARLLELAALDPSRSYSAARCAFATLPCAMLATLQYRRRGHPLSDRAAWALIRRSAAAVIASARGWEALEEERIAEWRLIEQRLQGDQAGRGGAPQGVEGGSESIGDGCAASGDAAGPSAAPAVPQPRSLLLCDEVAVAAERVLRAADDYVASLQCGAAVWMEAAKERWRMAAALALALAADSCDLGVNLERMGRMCAFEGSQWPRPKGWAMPAEPPLQVAVMVAGGFVTCLEALVRRSMRLLSRRGPRELLQSVLNFVPAYSWVWLLAYCEPAQAASLICSLRKGLVVLEEKLQLSAILAAMLCGSSGAGGTPGFGDAGGRAEAGWSPALTQGRDAASQCVELARMLTQGRDAASQCVELARMLLGVVEQLLDLSMDFFSESPQVGRPSAATQQLRSVLTAAVCELLPPLSRIVQRVAVELMARGAFERDEVGEEDDGGISSSTKHTAGTGMSGASSSGGAKDRIRRDRHGGAAASTDPRNAGKPRSRVNGSSSSGGGGRVRESEEAAAEDCKRAEEWLRLCLMPLLHWLLVVASDLMAAPALNQAPVPKPGESAAAAKRRITALAVAASAAAADPAGSTARREGWRRLLLDEVGALELVGAALQLLRLPVHQESWYRADRKAVLFGIARSALAVGAACGQELQAAAAVMPGSTSASSAGASSGPAASLNPAGASVDAGNISLTRPEGAPWASAASGSSPSAAANLGPGHVAALQRQLACWQTASIAELTGCCSGAGYTDISRNLVHVLPMLTRARRSQQPGRGPGMEARIKVPLLTHVKAAGLALLRPDVARQQLRTCANPRCTNLAGDNDSGLQLRPCSRCGAVAYCCEACEQGHWREGHGEVCRGGVSSHKRAREAAVEEEEAKGEGQL